MRIIVDAMGGDNAPDAIVKGAVDAHEEFGMDLVLVGRGEEILESLKRQGIDTLPQGMEIAHASDVVDMEDVPVTVLKTHADSSLVVGLTMLAQGQGDAFVSAGSTGALLTGATLLVRRIKGIRRAALAPCIPTKTGRAVLIDCGANAECTAEYLLQFALMGAAYARSLGVKDPKVALINNGTEPTKGGALQKQAYALLEAAGREGQFNFAGNLEARDVFSGQADVLVTDGFTGNVLLKSMEGTASFMSGMLKQMFLKNLLTKLAALACKSGINDMKKMMDYRETGGTLFLGISRPVVKAHGSSDARAIRSAIAQAYTAAQSSLIEDITNSAAAYKAAQATD